MRILAGWIQEEETFTSQRGGTKRLRQEGFCVFEVSLSCVVGSELERGTMSQIEQNKMDGGSCL